MTARRLRTIALWTAAMSLWTLIIAGLATMIAELLS
jgi:hypothetical protein